MTEYRNQFDRLIEAIKTLCELTDDHARPTKASDSTPAQTPSHTASHYSGTTDAKCSGTPIDEPRPTTPK